jgi:hypothetical protein
MCEDETVGKETVLLYMQNHALITQQEALLSLVTQSAMDAKKGANAPDDDKGKRETESAISEERAGTQEIPAECVPHDASHTEYHGCM